MSIKNIEIVCIPCGKCEQLKANIQEIVKGLELKNRVKIIYDFKHTTSLREISNFGINPSQTPALIINGELEAAGRINIAVLRNKLDSLCRY